MISMSKLEMIQYLKDYSMLSYLMMHNPKTQIGVLFDSYMIKNRRYDCDNVDYYDRMRRTYLIYVIMKIFSFTEDYLLNKDNYLNDNDLKDVEPDNLYSTNLDGLSKKKVIQLIRNGFNHNNDSDVIDRFKISVNAKNIEIEFKSIKRSSGNFEPVKMKLSVQKLLSIYNDMTLNRQNILSFTFDIPDDFSINSNDLYHEMDKISFVRYYFNSKLPKDVIDQFRKIESAEINDANDALKYSLMYNDLSSRLGNSISYKLNDDQKRKLVFFLDSYKKACPFYLDDDVNALMFYFLMKVIPVPAMKIYTLNNQAFVCERFLLDVNESYRNITDQVFNITFNGPNPFDSNDSWDQDTYKMLKEGKKARNHDLFRDLIDGETFSAFPFIMYVDSVITHCCNPGEVINIKGNDYPVDKIRNSFAHGRWFLSSNNYVCLYDADTRNANDYKLEFIAKLELESLVKWADNYVNLNRSRLEEIKGTYR